jgi:hypothetical protein
VRARSRTRAGARVRGGSHARAHGRPHAQAWALWCRPSHTGPSWPDRGLRLESGLVPAGAGPGPVKPSPADQGPSTGRMRPQTASQERLQRGAVCQGKNSSRRPNQRQVTCDTREASTTEADGMRHSPKPFSEIPRGRSIQTAAKPSGGNPPKLVRIVWGTCTYFAAGHQTWSGSCASQKTRPTRAKKRGEAHAALAKTILQKTEQRIARDIRKTNPAGARKGCE